MDEQLSRYAYLWTTEKNNWVLLSDEDSQREKDFIIYHVKSWRFLDIPDLALHRSVVEKMIEAGVHQVTDEDVFGK